MSEAAEGTEAAAESEALDPSEFPWFVSAGDILTDLVRGGTSQWLSHPGGAGWNVARAVARLGVPSACAGALGTDCFSDELWNASVAAGLDMRFMQRVDQPPLLAIVHETHPPAYFFIGEQSADLAFDPELLPEGWMAAAKWAHFGGVSLARQPLGATLATLAADLRAHRVKISFDPNYRNLMEHGYRPMLETMAALADLIKVSDEDLRCLFRTDEDAALEALRALNPHAAILVTRGPGAATLLTPGETITALPPRVDVVDTVGAGDASIGGFLFSLMRWPQRGWREHLSFALAAGAAACRHPGAHSPTLDEVTALVARAARQTTDQATHYVRKTRATMQNIRLERSGIMDDVTYTKGLYTATATVRKLEDGQYQGVVSLARDDATEPETTVYEAKSTSPTVSEALEEAKALAHQILGEIDL